MKYHPIDSALFVKNRSNFMAQMKANSLAVFNSNDIYPISADSTMPFQQHRDIILLKRCRPRGKYFSNVSRLP